MGYLDNIASSINNFSNLINNKVSQSNFNDQIAQLAAQANNTSSTSADPSLDSALSSLAGLLNGSSSTATAAPANQTAYIVNKLVQAGADLTKVNNLLNKVGGDTDDLAYTRTGPNDPNITLQNRNKVFGLDLQPLLSQAAEIAKRGLDINKYIDTAANIVDKGDYDDLRRFISVTSTVMAATNSSMYKSQSSAEVDKFFDFANDVLDKRHYDLESNIFDVQTMIGYGATLDTAINIMKNMENTGLTGRNNMVDLNRVTIDAKNKNLFLPYFFDQMSKSGDTRAFMDDYMKLNNMKTTAPDFTKFQRIERIDGEDMVIHQGDSAALFAQAVSNVQGLLPESSLYWSSLQTGAISHGSSYLDLSKLAPGTYDMYVKVGPGYGGTDTAMKRVVVLPKDEISDPVVIKNDGKLKITVEKGSAGLDSDLYMSVNGKEPQLITPDAQTNTGFTLEQDYKDGDQLDFFIRTHGDSWGLGTYDHGTDTANSPSGKAYYQKEQLSENSWRLRFEDLPEGQSDFDYDDVVIKVELIKNDPVISPNNTAPSSAVNLPAFNNTPFVDDTPAFHGQNTPSIAQQLLNLSSAIAGSITGPDKKDCKDKEPASTSFTSLPLQSAKKEEKKGNSVDYDKEQEDYQKSLTAFRKYVSRKEEEKAFDDKKISEKSLKKSKAEFGVDTFVPSKKIEDNFNVKIDYTNPNPEKK